MTKRNAVVLAAALAAAFAATPPVRAADLPPLVIAREGYLYAGGHVNTEQSGQPMTGQLYAEYQIPAKLTHKYPVVMIEGGGQTGTNFDATPDGRPGWKQYFLRRGYAVYTLDQVGRGRAPYWSDVYGPSSQARIDFVMRQFVTPEKFKLWPTAHLHTQFPTSNPVPGDPVFDNFYAGQVQAIPDFATQQKLNPPAMAALLDKIGPAIILTHSQSGSFNWPLVDLRPKLVKALLAVEPSGPPVHDVINHGAPDWFTDDPHTKLSGLGEVPLVYDPAVTDASPLSFVRDDKPATPEMARCWRQTEPARKLVNLQSLPILVISSEASYHAPYDDCTIGYLQQAGAHPVHVKLATLGIHGNGHMMMLEKNSDAIAKVMADWADKTVH
jgi:pimeloyl-ACP methyl ester carboxylesterase